MVNGEKQRRNWFYEVPSAEMKLASRTKKLVLLIASLVREIRSICTPVLALPHYNKHIAEPN